MKRLTMLAAVVGTVFLGLSLSAGAQTDATNPQKCPDTWCLPGEDLKITVVTAPPAGYQYVSPLTLVSADASKKLSVAFSSPSSPLEIKIKIPPEATDGTYNVVLQATKTTAKTATEEARTDTMTVAALNPAQIQVMKPVITTVVPSSAYSNQGNNEITLLGSGFRAPVQLSMKKYPTPAPCTDTPSGNLPDGVKVSDAPCYHIEVQSSRQLWIKFEKLDPANGYFGGPGGVSLLVGTPPVETNTVAVSLVNVSESTPLTAAVVVFVLIVGAIFLLLRSGRDATKQTMNGKTYWLSALFLDPQTNSYSLSKCQFYAWTAAAVLGYLFLAVSKSFVQGSAIFPDIPSGLPGILLASAGTAVISTGITSAKGDKGAGNPGPNLSDFIATGGVVAADRLQFAIWTLVGIGTFLAIVLQSDPRNINDLPAIPSGFLQLMGISSAGYVAGKLTRKAGPTLDKVTPSSTNDTPPQLKFMLTGSALSRSAKFSIDDGPIYPDTIRGSGTAPLPDIVQLDPTVGDPDFARILSFSVTQPQPNWLGGPHNFTITNPDGQKAMIPYQVFHVTAAELNSGAQTLTLTGNCLDNKLIVTYAPKVSGNATTSKNTKASDTEWSGTTAGVQTGTHYTLTVQDTAGVVYTKDVQAT